MRREIDLRFLWTFDGSGSVPQTPRRANALVKMTRKMILREPCPHSRLHHLKIVQRARL